ncbi:hypothetical protein KGM_203363 [Danaus plexippus plexippus]|uniref:Uncharacterized protein n=1 Tax=Danaus plexippus plexippus TaxID=278856 RepID=A0A212EQL1_DANPL|nr:hypothetical protein KGM_203363 [Danaus plexippus plexippus]
MADYKNSLHKKIRTGDKTRYKLLDDTSYIDDIVVNDKYPKDLRDFNSEKQNKPHIEAKCEKESSNDKDDIDMNDTKMRSDDTKQYEAIFRNIKNVKGILRRSSGSHDNNNKTINKMTGKCWYLEKFTAKLLLGKLGYRPCTRKSSFDRKFVQIITNVINKYADTFFKFTEEMTEILLESIFGSDTDVRNNIFDVNKLLRYLRKSVDLHKNHADGSVVTLTSKRCLTLSLPGCFCKPGFVESSGQCVLPSDCVTSDYKQYLTRIIVL